MGNIINANSLNDLKSQASIILLVDANGNALNFPSGGNIGDVVGPASSTDNAMSRFDGLTGKTIQGSNIIISDTGTMTPTVSGVSNLGSTSSYFGTLYANVVIAGVIASSGNDGNYINVTGDSMTGGLNGTSANFGSITGTNLSGTSIVASNIYAFTSSFSPIVGGQIFTGTTAVFTNITGVTLITGSSVNTETLINTTSMTSPLATITTINGIGITGTNISGTNLNIDGNAIYVNSTLHRVGIRTSAPTGTLTIVPTDNGTVDNAFVVRSSGDSSTVFSIRNDGYVIGSTTIQTTSAFASTFSTAANDATLNINHRNFTLPNTGVRFFSAGSVTNSSGLFAGISIVPTINQTGSASYVALKVNTIETTIGNGTQTLFDLQRNSVSQFKVDGSGNVTSVGSITPVTSGTQNVGTLTSPFSGVYANQYATTLISGVGATLNINWNSGTSQILNFAGVVSGTYTIGLTNGIPGSAYVLKTVQNASGTITLAWTVGQAIWQGGVSGTMTAASGTSPNDMFSFWYDGTKYLGSFSNNYY